MNDLKKIKRNGMTLKVRIMSPSEQITERSLCSNITGEKDITKLKFKPSCCVGDLVEEHPGRIYVEVVSPWYVGESTRSAHRGK